MAVVIDKACLIRDYAAILKQGLSPSQWAFYEQRGAFASEIIVQSTSGSGGKPLLIPRSREDIRDIFKRITRPYLKIYGELPKRIAMLGGISHSQAALKLTVDAVQIRSFALDDLEGLCDFNPDFLSCYPSVVRELMSVLPRRFPALRAVKLGGEHVYDVDLEKLWALDPSLLIIEQLGSTEMPAVAIGTYWKGERKSLALETGRFSFLLTATEEWQPFIVRDRFASLLFPIDAFYDSGDEVRLVDGQIADIRRRGHPENAFFESVEKLLRQGCINLQMAPDQKILYYEGAPQLPPVVTLLNGLSYHAQSAPLRRLPDSHKLPLLI